MGTALTMMIVSLCLAAVVILKKESIPQALRRPLALFSLFIVCASFVMMMIALYRL
jgi:hypothetical protein